MTDPYEGHPLRDQVDALELEQWGRLVDANWQAGLDLFAKMETFLDGAGAHQVAVMSLMVEMALERQLPAGHVRESWMRHRAKLVELVGRRLDSASLVHEAMRGAREDGA